MLIHTQHYTVGYKYRINIILPPIKLFVTNSTIDGSLKSICLPKNNKAGTINILKSSFGVAGSDILSVINEYNISDLWTMNISLTHTTSQLIFFLQN